jgi:hypothetical protein
MPISNVPEEFTKGFDLLAWVNDYKTADYSFLTWFETFLEEKNLPYEQWEITGPDGTTHMINSDVVIEQIKDAPSHEQAGIKDKIVQIDFANGDVNDYFKYLAEALVQNYGSAF